MTTKVFLAPLALLLGAAALATTYKVLTLDQLLAATEIGFYGEVAQVEVEDREGQPWTVVTFALLNEFVGTDDAENDQLTLEFVGGTLPSGETLTVDLMPQFTRGERVLVLAYERDLYSPIVGFRQGLWREGSLGLSDETGRRLSVDEDGELLLDGEGGATDVLVAAVQQALEDRE